MYNHQSWNVIRYNCLSCYLFQNDANIVKNLLFTPQHLNSQYNILIYFHGKYDYIIIIIIRNQHHSL